MEKFEQLINTIVEAMDDKKGQGIVSLDLSGFDGAICSNFVVSHADSTTQVDAISNSIEEKVFEVYSTTQEMGKLTSLFKPVLDDYNNIDEEDKFKVRSLLRNFNRFYSYMAQIVRTFDVELYKTYIFCELLYKLLPKTPHAKVDLSGKLELEHHKFTEDFTGSIVLAPTAEDKTLENEKGGSGNAPEEKLDYRLQVDMAGSPKICDLYLRYKPSPAFGMQLGQFKLPFAIENDISCAFKLTACL